MISTPEPPGCPTEALARPEDIVTGAGGRAVFLSHASVLADRYDGGAAAIEDCGVAPAGIKGAIAGHGADLFMGRDLVQQVGLWPAWNKGSSLTVSVGVEHAPSATRDHLANDRARSQHVAKEPSRAVRLPWIPDVKPKDTP